MPNPQIINPAKDVRLSPSDTPRRNADREVTPGRCANLDYCSIGMQRVLVQVPVNQPFVCPECGGRLRAPGVLSHAHKTSALPYLRVGVLVVAMAISLYGGYLIGRSGNAARGAASQTAGVKPPSAAFPPPPVAPSAVSPPPIAATPVAPPPSAVEAAAAAPPAKPELPMLIVGKPYPVKLGPVDNTVVPRHLLQETRFGQVTIDCALDALLTKPNCHISDVRGSDAFAQAALDWLSGLSVQYAPETRRGTQALLDHRWRVVFQDFSGRQGEDAK